MSKLEDSLLISPCICRKLTLLPLAWALMGRRVTYTFYFSLFLKSLLLHILLSQRLWKYNKYQTESRILRVGGLSRSVIFYHGNTHTRSAHKIFLSPVRASTATNLIHEKNNHIRRKTDGKQAKKAEKLLTNMEYFKY